MVGHIYTVKLKTNVNSTGFNMYNTSWKHHASVSENRPNLNYDIYHSETETRRGRVRYQQPFCDLIFTRLTNFES